MIIWKVSNFCLFSSQDDVLKRSIESQTDPVHDESAFDWDLSDRADIETQTNPPTRATSTNPGAPDPIEIQDAIVQTDQRLTFLLHRSEIKWIKKSGYAPASEGVGDTTPGGTRRGTLPQIHNGKRTFADAGVQTYIEVQSVAIQVDPVELSEFSGVRRKKSVIPFNFEDISDFSDADISTVHAVSIVKILFRDSESVVFNSGQKMALRAVYVVIR